MKQTTNIFKRIALPALALLLLLSTFVQSQDMDHSAMEKREGETNEMKGMEKMDGMDGEGMSGPDAMAIMKGKMIYSMSCTYCHGLRGDGDGAASIFIGPYSHPRPNRFTKGVFKFRSTKSGELPMLSDLMRTTREGIPGYMPSFRNLGEDGIKSVATYIAKEFIQEELPTRSTIKYVQHVGPYTYPVESVQRGRKLYKEMGCFLCHGEDGRSSKIELRDGRGLSIRPVDLGRQETFGNGTSHEDIYRTIMTGLDGTPMPGFSSLFTGEEDKAWDLVHYILSLQGR